MVTKEKEELIDSVGIIYSQIKKKADSLKIAEIILSEKIRMKYITGSLDSTEKNKEKNSLNGRTRKQEKYFAPQKKKRKTTRIYCKYFIKRGITEQDIQERLDSVYPFDWIIRKRENLKQISVNGYELWKLLSELHLIAKQLGEPINSPKVCLAYTKKHEGLPEDLSNFVFNPIYFAPEECYFYAEPELCVDPEFYEDLQKEAISKEIVEYVNEHYSE